MFETFASVSSFNTTSSHAPVPPRFDPPPLLHFPSPSTQAARSLAPILHPPPLTCPPPVLPQSCVDPRLPGQSPGGPKRARQSSVNCLRTTKHPCSKTLPPSATNPWHGPRPSFTTSSSNFLPAFSIISGRPEDVPKPIAQDTLTQLQNGKTFRLSKDGHHVSSTWFQSGKMAQIWLPRDAMALFRDGIPTTRTE